ncbi:TonB-dependent receptor [Granulicella mallensis]|uniref:Cna B domain protein n=1 Tax=Granulicella mallensis (strain ATCC BAA-1857 / DSM 23137 / MP5ACTX8) TaxID=682795 RepID=G8NPA3_GRAMM|nr:TonB-dependent receptor [Granulicella mallensis]AEU38302.1 Cna B domain protein [Granulicella mallensis MP5ACTX8]
MKLGTATHKKTAKYKWPENLAARVLVLACLLMVTPLAFCQGVSGRIVGTIQDATNAVVPGAVVTITNQDTGSVAKTKSNSSGEYRVDNLPPGNYQVKVEAKGFRTVISSGNVVTVDNANRDDIKLEVGMANQSVEVTAGNPLVDTTGSSLGEVLNERDIKNLPLNGRIFSQLVDTVPGAVATGPSSAPEAAAGAGAQTAITASVNGMPWSGTTYTLDGVSNMELLNAFMTVTPALDALQEVKVSTANADATVGTYGGAQVNALIKSGTNKFHGSAYEFFRNDSLNATAWDSTSKAPDRSNQFGGSLGGPIIKNKAFFFVDYQGLLLDNGVYYNLTVPTDLMKQGLFLASQFPAIYDPTTQKPFPLVTTAQGQAYQIPAARFDAVSSRMVGAANIWPEATNQNSIVNNYIANNTQTDDTHQFDVKVDYQLHNGDRLFGRESYQRRDLTAPSPGTQWINISNVNAQNRMHNAAVGYDHTFSPSATNELRFGFNRFYTKDFGNDFGTNENTTLGIPNGNIAGFPGASGLAIFNPGNVAATGSQDYTDAHRITNIYQITDNFTKVLGKHTLTVGEDYRRLQASLTNANANQSGSFSFNSDYTSSCTNQPSCPSSIGGNGFASFLLGLPSSLYRGFVNTDPATRANLWGVYGQDTYIVNKSLTLNLALRWDVVTQPVDKFNRQSNFNLTTGLLDIATSGNRAPNVDNYYGNVAPRVGFSYSPNNGKTAIRGAFGMTTFTANYGGIGGSLERNFPFFEQFYLNQQFAYTPWTQVSTDGLPGFVPLATDAPVTPQPNSSVAYMAKNFRPDNANSWNIGIQQQLTAQSAFTLTYVGTKGTHLFRERNINTPEPGPGDQITRRPYYQISPNASSINYYGADGASSYNALQAEVTMRFSHDLQGRVAYTWSKEIDDMNIFDPIPGQDRLNRGLGTGQAPDVPQIFVASLTYQLPFGQGRRWLTSSPRAVQYLAGGWQISTITLLQSGQPLTFGISSDNLNNGVSNRAELTCAAVGKVKKPSEWFDTSCFTTPAQYQLGNSGVGKVFGPGYENVDLSLSKSEKIHDEMNISVQVDAFNALNNPHMGNPNTTCCTSQNPLFGTITGTNGPPRNLQLGAHLTF